MSSVVLAESDRTVQNDVTTYLSLIGHTVYCCDTGAGVRSLVEDTGARLLICGSRLPDCDSFSLARSIHTDFPDLAIMMLGTDSGESFRILAFEVGCDDFILIPFNAKVLMLRVQAVLRRLASSSPENGEDVVIIHGGQTLIVKPSDHVALLDGKQIRFTAAEWRVLHVLVSRSGRLVSREEILSNCFEYKSGSYDRLIDTYIKNIRRKLEAADWIETIRGFGYRFTKASSPSDSSRLILPERDSSSS